MTNVEILEHLLCFEPILSQSWDMGFYYMKLISNLALYVGSFSSVLFVFMKDKKTVGETQVKVKGVGWWKKFSYIVCV